MNIHLQPDRPGYTYIPDAVDEATGERVEGTGMLAESHIANLVKEDQLNFEGQDPTSYEDVSPLTEEESIDADPDYIPNEVPATELSDITDEILEQSSTYDEAQASAVLEAPMGDTPGDVTVTYLAHQFYSGNLTAEEAYNEALNSGVSPDELARSYRKLQSYFQ